MPSGVWRPPVYKQLLQPDLWQMLLDDDESGMAAFCDVLHPAATAEILDGLETDKIWRVLSSCPLERRAEIFEFLELPLQVQLVEAADRKEFSALLEVMSPDDRADLLGRLDNEHVEGLLPLIAAAERNDIRKLLSFPEDSAGAIMTTEYASLPEEITAGEAIEQLRRQAPERETIYYVFILGHGRRLDGVVSLRELILAKRDARIADLMNRDVISVRVDDDPEEVAQVIARYDFIAVPVVDERNQLVGIITHDDVTDVVAEELEEDVQRIAAIEPMQDEYLATPLRIVAWKRGGWLMFLAFVALVTAQILKFYEGGERTGWMVMFLPLVLASGGNAGSQSATLVIRALATTDRERHGYGRMVLREFLVGLILGGCIAGTGFLSALAWFALSPMQSAVVGATVYLVVVMGTVIGAIFPITFERQGMDPAIMSTPLIAAIVDVMGVVIYYSVARVAVGG